MTAERDLMCVPTETLFLLLFIIVWSSSYLKNTLSVGTRRQMALERGSSFCSLCCRHAITSYSRSFLFLGPMSLPIDEGVVRGAMRVWWGVRWGCGEGRGEGWHEGLEFGKTWPDLEKYFTFTSNFTFTSYFWPFLLLLRTFTLGFASFYFYFLLYTLSFFKKYFYSLLLLQVMGGTFFLKY